MRRKKEGTETLSRTGRERVEVRVCEEGERREVEEEGTETLSRTGRERVEV